MTEKKCLVTIRDKTTGETMPLTVWAIHKRAAANMLKGVLTGWSGEYQFVNVRFVKDENGAAVRRRKEIVTDHEML